MNKTPDHPPTETEQASDAAEDETTVETRDAATKDDASRSASDKTVGNSSTSAPLVRASRTSTGHTRVDAHVKSLEQARKRSAEAAWKRKMEQGDGAAMSEASMEEVQAEFALPSPEIALTLSGPHHEHLGKLSKELEVELGMRGQVIRLVGPKAFVEEALRVLEELCDAMMEKHSMPPPQLVQAARMLRAHPELRLRNLLDDVVIVSSNKKNIAPRGLAQKEYIQSIRDRDIVFGIGPAGTGKTYLAMAMAVRALQHRTIKRIVITRPAVEAGEKLGFLPGTLTEKVDPYLRPLYDALHDMMDFEKVQQHLQRGVIEVAPLAFMRGRTLSESFVVLDEAQNTTVEQMKMFLTRLGVNSKAVITGDITQVDLPRGQRSGLKDALEILSDVPGIGVSYFSFEDVVRHPLVQRIIQAYEYREARRTAEREDRDPLMWPRRD